MVDIQKTIIKARPSLRKILPVVFWQTFVFSLLNVIIGIGVLLWNPTIFPLVAPNDILLTIWGILFITLGIALSVGLFTKHWERLRILMCIGLLFKICWSIALLFRIVDGGTLLIATLFIGLAALQAVCIIFYLPPDEATSNDNS